MTHDAKPCDHPSPRQPKRVYLDYGVRCPLRKEALMFWQQLHTLPQGFPAATYRSGRKAAEFLEQCRKVVRRALGVKEENPVVFFSSMTQAVFCCLDSAAARCTDAANTVLVSAAETLTVRQAVARWSKQNGWQVLEVPCNDVGCCDFDRWSEAISRMNGGVGIAVCCTASAEVGTLQPCGEIMTTAKQRGISVLQDVSCACCWMEPLTREFSSDYLLCSASRVGASDFGAFAVFPNQQTLLQEPEPIFLAGAFASVLESWLSNGAQKAEHVRYMRNSLCGKLLSQKPGTVLLGPTQEKERVPHILGLRFPGVETEALALLCDLRGVEFSHSPACVAKGVAESRLLLSMGLSPTEIRECCTLAVGPETTIEDVDFASEIIVNAAQRIEKI